MSCCGGDAVRNRHKEAKMSISASDIEDFHADTEKKLNRLRVQLKQSEKQVRDLNTEETLTTIGEMDALITELAHSNDTLFQKMHST
jgi:hypothetical protein